MEKCSFTLNLIGSYRNLGRGPSSRARASKGGRQDLASADCIGPNQRIGQESDEYIWLTRQTWSSTQG